MENQLKGFLKSAADWEKMSTDVPGVFIVRVPGPKANREGGARLMIEVNPVDENGNPKKRKGLFVADREMYIQFLEALQDDRINKILISLEGVNPKKQDKKMKKLKLE